MISAMTRDQHAIWFTERIESALAGDAHRLALGIWFDSASPGQHLDEARLHQACAAAIARHPALSTAVVETQVNQPELVLANEPVELRTDGLSAGWAAHCAPFRFDGAPLARFGLLTAPTGQQLLLVSAHHLIFDGESKAVLARHVAQAYNDLVAGRSVDLGRAPDPSTVDESTLVWARTFWRDRWSPAGSPTGSPAVLLPGLARPVRTEAGATVRVALPAAVSAGLGSTAERLGVTRFELLLSAVHILLARYGNAGLSTTVALSTRTAAEADEVGLFVHELPVAVAPAAGPVDSYAAQLRSRLRELYAVRAVSLAEAVPGLRPSAALTPVSVSYRRQPSEPTFTGVRSIVDWTMHPGAATNTLGLFIVDGADGPVITLRYSPTALAEADAIRFGDHLATVLGALVAGQHDIRTLPVASTAELSQLDSWNATDTEYPANATLPSLIAEQVAARPGSVAVIEAEQTWTYAELDAAVRRFAAVLTGHGVGPGSLVAVSLPRSASALVSLLAILHCGAAYLPVDPHYPRPRQLHILTDAKPALVITTPERTEAFAGHAAITGPVLALPSATGTAVVSASAAGGAEAADDAQPDAPAYVMYTSGSTGGAKGVVVPHRALVNLLLGLRDRLGSTAEHRWLALTSLSFDISGLELFLPLVTGAAVVIAPDGAATDAGTVDRLVRAHGVTHVQATPSGWRVLLDGGFGPAPVVALTGGEALPPALARELHGRVARLVNVYGPTETTIWSTVAEVPADVTEVTIGHPIANTRLYLLDANDQPVPLGLPGELHIGGAGVAHGYLNRAELTSERFVDDPVRGRRYRTGDLCRQLPDGQFVYIGRSDNQVKIRGHRIELGEIEARLLDHPAVAEVAVVARGDDPTRYLAAYVVPRTEVDVPELRRHLAAVLPDAMVPTRWSTMDRLPRSPNGKIDRAALPDPGPATTPQHSGPPPAANDEVVAQLRLIWQDVLQVPEIGVDDDLFDLGGHSLSVTRIGSRIHQVFGVRVELDTFFDMPTIAEIAPLVRDGMLAGQR